MSELERQPPRDGCPSDLTLDRWVAGERRASDAREHLASCERCRGRVAGFEADREAGAPIVARLVARAAEQTGNRRVWSRWLLGGGLTVAAAAVALIVSVTGPPPDGIRAKGSSMRFVVQRDGRVFAGTSGDLFQPGDALRFLVSSGAPTHFLLVGIEENGRVSAYYPYQGSVSAELGPGADLPLPGSLVLDNERGTEYFLGIFAEEPVTLAEIGAAVAEAQGHLSLSTLRGLPLPGSHHWVVIRKE